MAARAEVRAQLESHDASVVAASHALPPLRLGSCRFTLAKRMKLLAYCNDESLSGAVVDEMRANALAPIKPIAADRARALQYIYVEVPRPTYSRDRFGLVVYCLQASFVL